LPGLSGRAKKKNTKIVKSGGKAKVIEWEGGNKVVRRKREKKSSDGDPNEGLTESPYGNPPEENGRPEAKDFEDQ